ncbi:hypothetical protein PYR71_15770 [Rhizobium sp. MC63]|uniref:Uncharacterized protein n=1 Tax=Rhizobium mulingense TaxID=3031128 RepID=A0ACC6N4W6_9HYPH|nr:MULTISPECIES: hypothetical protein [unclassified Rhizobium]MDF0697933.1 hypothetical protein [Rhizobium sp. MC63]MEA3520634.1 hypothetical protein [Rhizobium sp. MJ31]
MDAEAFATVVSTVAVAIVCGIITYRVSIRQVKAEIAAAFQEHIEKMHNQHKEFVQAVQGGDGKD